MEPTKKETETGARKNLVYSRLYALICHERYTLLLGSFAMIASSLSNQALPKLIGSVIDNNNRNLQRSTTNASTFSNTTTLLYCIVLGGGLASFVRTSMLGRAKENIATRLRKDAVRAILINKPVDWVQSVDPAAIATVLQTDITCMAESLTTSLANVLRSSSSVLFGTYHMLALDPTLFATSAALVPILGAATLLLRARTKRVQEQHRQLETRAATFVSERLAHVQMVKLSNKQQDEVCAYNQLQKETNQLAHVAAVQQGVFMGFLFVASSGALLLVCDQGARSVRMSSSGQLTSFATYSFLLALGTTGIMSALNQVAQGMLAAERYYQLVGLDDEQDQSTKQVASKDNDGVTLDVSKVKSMAMKDIRFGYQSTGKQVLANVSLQLVRGNVVALVGKNGSGKTTLSAILAGLYAPVSGKVLIDGTLNFASVNKETKKKLVQVIPQSSSLFNMSILENVRYSQSNATEDEVRQALLQANCNEFVSRLEEGIYFNVGLNGSKLSGGERQRLALARALLSDPVVLVMDEPGTSLDAAGESAVAEAVKECKQGDSKRALLLITHQSKSLNLADEIVVLDEGCVVERGTFQELSCNPASRLCQLMPDLLARTA
jgi:ATP-binding cassette subfamily B protein